MIAQLSEIYCKERRTDPEVHYSPRSTWQMNVGRTSKEKLRDIGAVVLSRSLTKRPYVQRG